MGGDGSLPKSREGCEVRGRRPSLLRLGRRRAVCTLTGTFDQQVALARVAGERGCALGNHLADVSGVYLGDPRIADAAVERCRLTGRPRLEGRVLIEPSPGTRRLPIGSSVHEAPRVSDRPWPERDHSSNSGTSVTPEAPPSRYTISAAGHCVAAFSLRGAQVHDRRIVDPQVRALGNEVAHRVACRGSLHHLSQKYACSFEPSCVVMVTR
jgi:hypothetical protein